MHFHPVPAAQRGFSLVELLAVLAVAAVLLGVGLPSLRSLVGSMAASAASNDLLADLLFARSEALKRKARVTLCKSADGATCTTAGRWDQGWIVFVDSNGNGTRAAGELLLQRQQALGGDLHALGNGTLARYVAYAPDGSTRQVGGAFQAGTLTVCRPSAEPVTGRLIVINANGRPRVQKSVLDGCP
ncbi:GspH/FimT family protein [Ramlibacter algicola]|uniref:Type II secretion system protein H n=1 Tax=Ramlibacter algicola TaxID=2795217 RepID=A0A934URQ8_9BURK|nr:GspH/FimT family protein [Ramlibacter algicola]MBK0392948.1 GspH/FimT family protein [Ramlibacter algicola]